MMLGKPEVLHVIPIDDLKEHVASVECWCDPYPDEDCPEVIVHNSADGREHTYEQGKVQ